MAAADACFASEEQAPPPRSGRAGESPRPRPGRQSSAAVDLIGAKRADADGHQPVAEVAVGRKLARRPARGWPDGRAGRRRWRSASPPHPPPAPFRASTVTASAMPSEKTAAAPAAGGDAAHRILGADGRAGRQKPWPVPAIASVDPLAGGEVQRDVAAIVDIGRSSLRPAIIAAIISSATEPATAAIGVMKSCASGTTAASMRRAVGPAKRRGDAPAGRRSSASSSTSSGRIVWNRATACR